MALIDSKACFLQRLAALGLETLAARCQALRLDSFGAFAYACPYVPGQSDEAPFEAFLLQLGATPEQGPQARRLFCESVALTAAVLKGRTERTTDDPPRR